MSNDQNRYKVELSMASRIAEHTFRAGDVIVVDKHTFDSLDREGRIERIFKDEPEKDEVKLPKDTVTITVTQGDKVTEAEATKLPSEEEERFSAWWVKSGLRMPREPYMEEGYIDWDKCDNIGEGYWSAEDVAKAVEPLLAENEKLRNRVDHLKRFLQGINNRVTGMLGFLGEKDT